MLPEKNPLTLIWFFTASCDSGYQLNSNGECIACPIGQYRDAEVTRTCVSCPSGNITLYEASKSLTDCNISKYFCFTVLFLEKDNISFQTI